MSLYPRSLSHAILAETRTDKPDWDRYLNRTLSPWLLAMGTAMLSIDSILVVILCLLVLIGLFDDAPVCMAGLQRWRRGTTWERRYAQLISSEVFHVRDLCRPTAFVVTFLLFAAGLAHGCGMFHPGHTHWLPMP